MVQIHSARPKKDFYRLDAWLAVVWLEERSVAVPGNVDFVSYDGEYPNLCAGTLVIEVDGERWEFPQHSLGSGGYVTFDSEWNEDVGDGPWHISNWPNGFPDDQVIRDEVVRVVNANVRYGCCGGCV